MKMELSSLIHLGMQREETFTVEDSHSAMHVGSGASRVLATPWMIAFMERNAHRLLAEKLPDGYSSVGVLVNVRHLAPTPVGSRLRVMARVIGIDGLKVTFNVEAWDQQEQVGEGMHERFVIETQRFLQRVETKMKLMEKS
jgi:fluoroacetyl-CoA thioesterase